MTTENSNDFDSMVRDLRATIRQSLIDSPAFENLQADEWLRTLYESYTQRFLSDNSRIWITGSIMIPLSLAAFAALPTIECPTFIHLLVLAIASVAVMVSWLVIAENHRAFQEKSRAWIVAIEETLGLEETGGPKIRENLLNRMLTFAAAVQIMRWVLTFSVIIGWILVLVFWPRFA